MRGSNRFLIRREMARCATPSKCRHGAKHALIGLDHRPCREGVVECSDAAPFEKQTRERLAEVDASEPRWAFREKDRTKEVVDAASRPE